MKSIYNFKTAVKAEINNLSVLKVIGIILCFVLNQTIGFAQPYYYKTNKKPNHTKVGLGIETFLSGNGHGANYAPYLNLTRGNNVIFGGPIIQKRTMTVGGAKIGYSRILTGGDIWAVDDEGETVDQRFQLNAFGYLQYSHNLLLSYSSLQIEESCNKALDYDWSKLRLNTVDFCAGIEFHYKINENISWKSYFGASIYNHLNYKPGMYQEKVKGVLVIGTGIHIRSFRK